MIRNSAIRGVEYAIDSLIHKEVGSINQLVLETSTGLPNDYLIFELDGERYAISECGRAGTAQGHSGVDARLSATAGWSAGGTMTVKLMRPRPYNPCRMRRVRVVPCWQVCGWWMCAGDGCGDDGDRWSGGSGGLMRRSA